MSSLPGRMQRRGRLKAGEERDPDSVTRNINDKFYEVLHFTRGWKRISVKRIWAGHKLAHLLGGRP